MTQNNQLPKRVHMTGICGVATSALAIALHKAGVAVTGSDKGFFPPVSTYLTEAGVPYYAGWHPENIELNGKPDVLIAGAGGTSPSNPEIVYAKEHDIPVLSFAEALARYVVKKNSIVTVGTWGKTTSSAMLSFVLLEAGWNPSYFTGGLSLSHPTGAISSSDWSVVEGDEYQIAIWDKRPKFAVYEPTHLLLTSVSWDHADLYPTEKDYFDTFDALLGKIPQTGMIVACIDDAGVQKTLKSSRSSAKLITYGKSELANYSYHSITYTKSGIHFQITNRDICYEVRSPMLGRFNAENITGVFAMAHCIGIAPDKIIAAIQDFKGIKRRFEKRFEGEATLLDCHAPTPEKAASVLESVREVYKGTIYAVYEPNIGGRQRESADKYDGALKDADEVIIPRLSKLKIADDGSQEPMDGPELTERIAKTHKAATYIEDDTKLVEYIASHAKKDDCIVFLGSHGFRGMIEETIKKLV